MEEKRQDTLSAHFATANAPLRPIMTSLNGDNSWLLSFPRPPAEQASVQKAFYHVVFEPWLDGPLSILGSWFVHIRRSEKARISTPEAIEGVIRQIEQSASAALPHRDAPPKPSEGGYAGGIDAILLGFHYGDHLHEATLRSFDESIPVIATLEAIKIVEPWGHFKTIRTIANLDPSSKSWREDGLHPGDPLPSWLSPVRFPGHAELNYSIALVWSHADDDGDQVHEVLFQTPHGTRLDEGPLQAFLDAEPKTEKLAMLHGFKESYTLRIQTTLGVNGGLAFYRRVGGPKYWVLTHHSPLLYSGVFMWLTWTNDVPKTLNWALGEEAKASGKKLEDLERPNVIQVENGGCLVLER